MVYLGTLVFDPVASVAIAYVVEQELEGHAASWRDALGHGIARLPSLIGTELAAGLVLLALTLALIIPGIIWEVYYFFYVYVVALRGIWGKKALNYSKSLVEGQWWRVVGIGLVILATLLAVTLIVALPFVMVAAVSKAQVFSIIGGVTVNVVTALFTVMMVVWFLNLDYLKHGVPTAGTRGRPPALREVPPPLVPQRAAGPAHLRRAVSAGFRDIGGQFLFQLLRA